MIDRGYNMKQSINFWGFCDAFRECDRENRFTYGGKRALFDWLEALDADCGTETELDVIALCCEFTEYGNLAELQADYTDIKDMDSLNDNTTVIMIDDTSFIIQAY